MQPRTIKAPQGHLHQGLDRMLSRRPPQRLPKLLHSRPSLCFQHSWGIMLQGALNAGMGLGNDLLRHQQTSFVALEWTTRWLQYVVLAHRCHARTKRYYLMCSLWIAEQAHHLNHCIPLVVGGETPPKLE